MINCVHVQADVADVFWHLQARIADGGVYRAEDIRLRHSSCDDEDSDTNIASDLAVRYAVSMHEHLQELVADDMCQAVSWLTSRGSFSLREGVSKDHVWSVWLHAAGDSELTAPRGNLGGMS